MPSPFEGDSPPIRTTILASPQELPPAPRLLVRILLLLTQATYLSFYVGALANLDEIRDIFVGSQILSPSILMTVLVATAVVLIPVRLFVLAGLAFNFPQLPEKFRRLFPGAAAPRSSLGAVTFPAGSSRESRAGAGNDGRAGVPAICAALADADVREGANRAVVTRAS